MNKRTALEIGAMLVLPDRPLQIKLLGDSITHGCGSPTFRDDGAVIVETSEWVQRRNDNGYCWANLFSRYVQDVCGCKVINNAMAGTDITHAIQLYDQLISEDDDIVMVMYGCNNRHEFYKDGSYPQHTREEHMRQFLAYVSQLRERLEEDRKDYVFLSGPCDSLKSESENGVEYIPEPGTRLVRHFHMWDLNNMLMKDSVEHGYPFIPVYLEMIRYFAARGADPRDYREWCEPAGGVHLNEAGSRLVYRLVLEGLGLSVPPTV